MNTIPFDILNIIIEYVANEYTIDHMRIRKVCHRWEDVARSREERTVKSLPLFIDRISHGLKVTKIVIHKAVWDGNLEVLQHASTITKIDYSRVEGPAAFRGHLHILQWLEENGHRFHEFVTLSAAEGGHLEVLKWLRLQGYHNKSELYHALPNHYLEVASWIIENSPEKHWANYIRPIRRGDVIVMQWLFDNGWPLNKSLRERVKDPKMIEWLNSHDCP